MKLAEIENTLQGTKLIALDKFKTFTSPKIDKYEALQQVVVSQKLTK